MFHFGSSEEGRLFQSQELSLPSIFGLLWLSQGAPKY